MSKTLLIVESPTKAQTIRRLLGSAYEVVASQGHVQDLPEKGLGLKIEKIGDQYRFHPDYRLIPKREAIVREIKKAVQAASQVYLATDEDREGEAIAWHLCKVLGINGEASIRITFHEITKRALQQALKNPRAINFHLVDAQQARRVLDRLVGYQLSPLLWRAFPGRNTGRTALSAGRVQSVALRLIVEREREIASFRGTPGLVAEVYLTAKPAFRATLVEPAIPSLEEGQQWLQQLVGKALRITSLQKKERRRGPSAPFTTSTLQQEAQRRLGFSLQRTMRAAQSLYEKGLITYMRTDSVHLAPEALSAIHTTIEKLFGAEAVVPRTWEDKKSLHAQEAHEAIRPTHPEASEAGDTPDEKKLYTLIWRRTLASQMSDAIYEETILGLEPLPLTDPVLRFEAKGKILLQPGFLALYGYEAEEEEEATLPLLREGDELVWEKLRLWEKFPSPPPRYTEGTLVRELETLGIGRPSTYAPTMETLFKRRYVERGKAQVSRPPYMEITLYPDGKVESQRHTPTSEIQRSKLLPTPLGIQVTDFLVARFPDIMNYDFTARVEEELDQIAAGKIDWQTMLSTFYTHFTDELERAKHIEKRSILLGTDPVSQKPVYLHIGGTKGAYIALGEKEDPTRRTASVPLHLSVESLSLEAALRLLAFPRVVGEYEGEQIEVRQGPYGYYIRHGKKNYPLPSGADPLTLTEAEAISVIETRRKGIATVLRSFPEAGIEILQGRYGPYIRHAGGTHSLPKGISVDTITLETCKALIQEKAARVASRQRIPKARKKP